MYGIYLSLKQNNFYTKINLPNIFVLKFNMYHLKIRVLNFACFLGTISSKEKRTFNKVFKNFPPPNI